MLTNDFAMKKVNDTHVNSVLKALLLTQFLLGSFVSFGQNCDCSKEFSALVNKIESDYAGFHDKVNHKSRGEYNAFTAKLRKKADNTTTFLRCTKILDEWLGFFNDKHLQVSFDKNIYFTYKKIDPQTILLRIPSFSWDYKEMIDSLVKSNFAEITTTPVLIVDIRGNGGGTDYSFTELLPLIYTAPYLSKGVEWWASQGNINYFEQALREGNIKKGKEEETRQLVGKLKAHPGSFVSDGDPDTVRYDKVYPFPQFVGIIADDFCASSSEQFILSAKESRKTTIFGTTTLGVLDYSNTVPCELPTKNLTVRYPMTRSSRLPDEGIDNKGIRPDVEIHLPVNLNVGSEVDDWVKFVQDYYRKKMEGR